MWPYLTVLASVCALQVALGALPSRGHARDFFILLDGGWRLANGQTPNVDFCTGYGVWVWNPIRWAFAVYGYNADAIGLARAFYTAILGLWFLLLSRIEPRRVPSLVLGLFLLIFISAPRPLGEYPTWISNAMFYDRVGYALLFLMLFEQLGAFRFEAACDRYTDRMPAQAEFWRGVSTGTALACTVMVKSSFVAPGLVLLIAGLLLFGIRRRHFLGVLAGGLAMLVFAIACLHFRPLPFLHHTLVLGHQPAHHVNEALRTLVQDMGGVLLALAAGLTVSMAGFSHRRIGKKYVLATMAIVACDIVCPSSNAMRSGLPLASWWCLSGALLLFSVPVPFQTNTGRLQRISALLVVCPLTLPIFLMDVSSSVYSIVSTAKQRDDHKLRFDSLQLRNWVPRAWLGDHTNHLNANGKPLILITNDGIHLLQTFSRPNETVSSIADDNAFSFALGRRPAEGGVLGLDIGNDIDHLLPKSTVIGRPDLLMVLNAAYRESNTTAGVLWLYPSLLGNEFALVGSSQYWTLYRRRS